MSLCNRERPETGRGRGGGVRVRGRTAGVENAKDGKERGVKGAEKEVSLFHLPQLAGGGGGREPRAPIKPSLMTVPAEACLGRRRYDKDDTLFSSKTWELIGPCIKMTI